LLHAGFDGAQYARDIIASVARYLFCFFFHGFPFIILSFVWLIVNIKACQLTHLLKAGAQESGRGGLRRRHNRQHHETGGDDVRQRRCDIRGFFAKPRILLGVGKAKTLAVLAD
jgi:hypothetical protein